MDSNAYDALLATLVASFSNVNTKILLLSIFCNRTTRNGAGETIEREGPYGPARLAVIDLGALDILDNLGVDERIVGVSKGSSIFQSWHRKRGGHASASWSAGPMSSSSADGCPA